MKKIINMKKINLLLRKCKSLSRQLSRSSSYSNLRSRSTREDLVYGHHYNDHHFVNELEDQNNNNKSATIFVGSSKKRYIIGTKYLTHPLFEALLHKSSNIGDHHDHDSDQDRDHDGDDHSGVLVVKCEVVLFDHLLWMLENADPVSLGTTESFEELAALYVF